VALLHGLRDAVNRTRDDRDRFGAGAGG
jgi:hypothetical protein